MELQFLGRLGTGSNMVFLAAETSGDTAGRRWIAKPVRGEAPLHDFPAGVLPPAAADPEASFFAQLAGSLAAREVATYLVAQAAGWDVVPETRAVYTTAGPSMVQRWIDLADASSSAEDAAVQAPHYEPLVDVFPPDDVPAEFLPVLSVEDEHGRPLVVAHKDTPRLRRIALLDAVINNADRKAGHLLRDAHGTEWAIDHGLSFHVVPKIRSVLWGFTGHNLGTQLRHDLADLRRKAEAGALAADLAELLSPTECAAFRTRIERLEHSGRFPGPTVQFPLPWPLF